MPHKFAFPFHKGIYDAYPQAQCVMHLHTKYATAVAMQEQGLIPGNQYAHVARAIGYHDYEGLLSTPEEGQRLAKNFGNKPDRAAARPWLRAVGPHRCTKPICWRFWSSAPAKRKSARRPARSKPYVPPQSVLDATIGQARIITDGNEPFNQMTWRALLRKLDRDAPDYKT